MIYNEYAQVLEATNPATGELYKPEDLNVFNWNDVRSAMLQDALFVREAWLAKEGNRDIAVRFVRASLKGWIYCRDNPADCVQYTTEAGSQLGVGHQNWMMNEINALVWPSPCGIGVLDPIGWNQTVQVAKQAGIIKQDPSTSAYDTSIVDRGAHGHRGRHEGRLLHQGDRRGHPGRRIAARVLRHETDDGRLRDGAGRLDSRRAAARCRLRVRPTARGGGPYTRGRAGSGARIDG